MSETSETSLFSEAAWDERYRSRDSLWSGKPNPSPEPAARDAMTGSMDCGGVDQCAWHHTDVVTVGQ